MTEADAITVTLPGACALFTTRAGGVSPAPYDTLNLGFLTDDDPSNIRRNRELVAERTGGGLAHGRQVHGNRVRTVRSANPQDGAAPPEGDALATDAHGLGLMVLAADCLPIVLAGDGAVAAVHAGWQGLDGGVLAAAVAALAELGATPRTLEAVIGPGAGSCCYEVGDDLHARFAARGEDFRRGRNLDLKAIATHQLRAAGVTVVHDVEQCTICSSHDRFFSHRRDQGLTGRQAGVAWLS